MAIYKNGQYEQDEILAISDVTVYDIVSRKIIYSNSFRYYDRKKIVEEITDLLK